MKRSGQLQRAGTASARTPGKSNSKESSVVNYNGPTLVRSLHCVGGKRPNANAKRRKHMATKAGFATYDALQAFLRARQSKRQAEQS